MMRIFLKLMSVALTTLALADPARAELILRAESITTTPGSSGSFLVTLENSGPEDVPLLAYLIQMTADVPWLHFTGVAIPAAPDYVFPGAIGPDSSDFDPPFTSPTTWTTLDFSASPDGFDVLTSGHIYGVLQVGYAIDAGTSPGVGQIQFVSPGPGPTDLTQLADGSAELIDFRAVNGAVTVVPEPPSMVCLTWGLVTLAGYRRIGSPIRPGRGS